MGKLITKNDMKKYIKENGVYLSRDYLKEKYKELYGEAAKASMKKADIWKAICKKAQVMDIYEENKEENFGVSTFDLEAMLNIDKTQRKKLEKRDILKVAYYKTVKNSGGFSILVPCYDLAHLHTLDKEKFYDMAAKCVKKQATAKQLEALEKARKKSAESRICSHCGRSFPKKYLNEERLCKDCREHLGAIKEIKNLLDNKNRYVILDTETTGLSNDDKIIEIAIIDLDGNELLNTRVKTDVEISKEAASVHGISQEDLANAPEFNEIIKDIEEVLEDKIALIFNEEFDIRMLRQSGYKKRIHSKCLMNLYMEYAISDKWISLTNAMKYEKVKLIQDHSAKGDCICCLELMKAIVKNNK